MIEFLHGFSFDITLIVTAMNELEWSNNQKHDYRSNHITRITLLRLLIVFVALQAKKTVTSRLQADFSKRPTSTNFVEVEMSGVI